MNSNSRIELRPFKVAIFDDYFNPCLVQAACEEWPANDWFGWHKYSDGHASKYASRVARDIPASCLTLLDEMSKFPLFDLCPYFYQHGCFPDMQGYYGGGLHMFTPGGMLDCHLDALNHPSKPWQRVVNLLLYIMPDWEASWGGQLNLHDADKRIVNTVQPKFNRLVLFQPTRTAWHSVSPISNECGQYRKSLATFFWKRGESVNSNTCAKFE